jgi:hypothetical protein
MADPGKPEGQAWLKERSPFERSGEHQDAGAGGARWARDPRVTRAEAEQIVIALRESGVPV